MADNPDLVLRPLILQDGFAAPSGMFVAIGYRVKPESKLAVTHKYQHFHCVSIPV